LHTIHFALKRFHSSVSAFRPRPRLGGSNVRRSTITCNLTSTLDRVLFYFFRLSWSTVWGSSRVIKMGRLGSPVFRCSGSVSMQKLQRYLQLEAGRHLAHVVYAQCRYDMQAVATRCLLTLALALLCNIACRLRVAQMVAAAQNLIRTSCATFRSSQPPSPSISSARTTLHGLQRSANHHPHQRHGLQDNFASSRPRSTVEAFLTLVTSREH
jgi:hypothetical protein